MSNKAHDQHCSCGRLLDVSDIEQGFRVCYFCFRDYESQLAGFRDFQDEQGWYSENLESDFQPDTFSDADNGL